MDRPNLQLLEWLLLKMQKNKSEDSKEINQRLVMNYLFFQNIVIIILKIVII